MSKMNLTEATMLALQGKLDLKENKRAKKRPVMHTKKSESIDINVDDKTNVSVMDDETVVDTEEATIIVDKKDDVMPMDKPVEDTVADDVVADDVVEIPVDSDDTIIPEDLPEAEPIVDEPLDAGDDIDLPLADDTEKENEFEESKQRANKNKSIRKFETRNVRKNISKSKKTESFDEDDLELTEEQMWDYLNQYCGVSEETLKIVTDINGYSRETLNDILWAISAYRSFKQYMEYEDKDNYDVYFGDKEVDESKKLNKTKRIEARRAQINKKRALEARKARIRNMATKKEETKSSTNRKSNINKTKSDITKCDLKSFNEALTKCLTRADKMVESVNVTKAVRVNGTLKLEANVSVKNNKTKTLCIEMKSNKTSKNFTKYTNLKENKQENMNLTMLTFKNKDNVLECRYINRV